jgi:hypothetical protein
MRDEVDAGVTAQYLSTLFPFQRESSVVDVWANSKNMVYAAGFWGIYRGVPKKPGGFIHDWELFRVTTSACTALSGLTDDDVVGISMADTHWVHGNDVDMVHRDDLYWTDICWATVAWAVQVGFDPDGGYSVLFDDPLVDHEGRDRRILTKERLNAVAAWTVGADKYAMTVGEAGVEFKLADMANDVNDGFWSEDGLAKRDSTGGIADWTDLSVAPDVLDAALYGLRGGQVVKCSLSVPGFPGTVLPRPGDLVPYQIFCSGEDDVWITGIEPGGIDWWVSHFDGQGWSGQWMSSMDQPRDIWVADPQNVFVACDNGIVYRMGGIQTFMPAVTPPQHLYGVWGTSADSVWVCGANGTVSHGVRIGPSAWTWTKVPLDPVTNVHLWAIDGSGKDNIVAVGEFGTVIRYKDGTWSDFSPPATLLPGSVRLTMVAALHPDDVWIASPDGFVLHWDGTDWIKWTTGMPSRLNALWGRDGHGGDVWLAGEDDLLLRQADPPAVLPLIENK